MYGFKTSKKIQLCRDLHTSHGKFRDILRFRLKFDLKSKSKEFPAHILMGLQSDWEFQPIYFIFLGNWSEMLNYPLPRAILWWNKSRHTHRTPFSLILFALDCILQPLFSDHLRKSPTVVNINRPRGLFQRKFH